MRSLAPAVMSKGYHLDVLNNIGNGWKNSPLILRDQWNPAECLQGQEEPGIQDLPGEEDPGLFGMMMTAT